MMDAVHLSEKANKHISWQQSREPARIPICGEADSWAVCLRCEILPKQEQKTASVMLCAFSDSSNYACFAMVRGANGSLGFRRYICRDGLRLQPTGSEVLMDIPEWDGAAELTFLFCHGRVCLFLTRADGRRQLVSAYDVPWDRCRPELQLHKAVEAELSAVTVMEDAPSVFDRLMKPQTPKASARFLFLGNSCLYYYDLPNTFARLAGTAGYWVQVNTVARGSASLAMFTDPNDELCRLMRAELAKGYDAVFFQGLSSDIDTPEGCRLARAASAALVREIRAAGSQPWAYCRPPVLLRDPDGDGVPEAPAAVPDGKKNDALYGGISRTLGTECVYVNRAFVLAHMEKPGIALWYKDQAHPGPKGAYLAACVLFASCFRTSCRDVGDDGLPSEEAAFLRQIADRVALQNEVPAW